MTSLVENIKAHRGSGSEPMDPAGILKYIQTIRHELSIHIVIKRMCRYRDIITLSHELPWVTL